MPRRRRWRSGLSSRRQALLALVSGWGVGGGGGALATWPPAVLLRRSQLATCGTVAASWPPAVLLLLPATDLLPAGQMHEGCGWVAGRCFPVALPVPPTLTPSAAQYHSIYECSLSTATRPTLCPMLPLFHLLCPLCLPHLPPSTASSASYPTRPPCLPHPPPTLAPSAARYHFICECFFRGGRALQLGFKKALDAYEGWSRQVGGRGEGRGEVGALRVALRATSFGGEGCSRDTCAHAWPRSRGSRV